MFLGIRSCSMGGAVSWTGRSSLRIFPRPPQAAPSGYGVSPAVSAIRRPRVMSAPTPTPRPILGRNLPPKTDIAPGLMAPVIDPDEHAV